MFLISVRVNSSVLPAGRMLTLASHRKLPSSMLPVDTPRYWRTARRLIRYCRASSGERMSGSLTVSMSGIPERFTSTRL